MDERAEELTPRSAVPGGTSDVMTITIGNFGEQHGRLGNQLFQVGLLFAASRRCGYRFYLPHRDEALGDCFDLDVAAEGPGCTSRFDESNGSCNFDPRVFEQPDGTC